MTGGPFEEYRKGLGDLSEAIKNSGQSGGFVAVFAVRGDDPIKHIRRNLNKSYMNISISVSSPLKRVLDPPLDIAASTLAKAVSSELEENWNDEPLRYYKEKISGRYPFDKNGADLPWSDFEDFFKPQSGILWKFADQNLSGLIERAPKGWTRAAQPPSIPISANDDIIICLNRASRIANSFFKTDGAAKRQDITFSPFTSSSWDIQFLIGEKRLDFQGGLPVTVNRSPGSGGETVVLRIMSSDRALQESRFGGEWGLMKFLDAGKIEKLGGDRYRIRWGVPVQNIYTAQVTAIIQSNIEALFDESVMRSFDVPERVLGR